MASRVKWRRVAPIPREKVFSTVEIHLTRNPEGGGGQAPCLVYGLKNVVISSPSICGHAFGFAQDYERSG
jgi:hypothetical protein